MNLYLFVGSLLTTLARSGTIAAPQATLRIAPQPALRHACTEMSGLSIFVRPNHVDPGQSEHFTTMEYHTCLQMNHDKYEYLGRASLKNLLILVYLHIISMYDCVLISKLLR